APADGGLPGYLTAVIVEERAAVSGSESGDLGAHGANALGRGDRRARSAHVRLHPARMEDNGDDAARRKVDGKTLRHRVERRLARPVDVVAAARVVGDAAHPAGQVHDALLLSALQMVKET